ncbi:hypothetical protein BGZ63DRAFT_415920 [Mariannaea sp. PMI_226]|nr:hypothetical protein BGZ63DRAFT_415920 [Mariannaea sp. PMI_226]
MPRPLSDQTKPVCQQCQKSNRYCDRSEKALQIREASLNRPLPTLQDPKIARLYYHYVENLSKWYDLSDSTSTFAIAIPRAALDEPLLFCAIIALSAMHTCKTTASSLMSIADLYHRHCVRLLIALTENDDVMTNGVALAATCLLRSYEILDSDIDPNMHLRGAYSMVSIQDLLSGNLQGGILAAGFWNYLREDITFSLFEDCPLKIDLDAVSILPRYDSDEDYLNSITLILGKAVNLAFSSEGEFKTESWESLLQMTLQWSAERPEWLHPFSYHAGGPGESTLFPQIWFLQSCHASTMHYYSILLMLLRVNAEPDHLPIFNSLHLFNRDPTDQDAFLEALALDICGITFTTKIPSVIVNAFGPISYSAKFIRAEATRQELIRHLLACKSTIGWPVQRLADDLKESWRRE